MEMLMIAGLTVYFVNFFTGRSKNQRIANAWFSTHRQILEENFTLVGKSVTLLLSFNLLFFKRNNNLKKVVV